MAQGKADASVTAENTGTDWIRTDRSVNITVSGTFVADITLQMRFVDQGVEGSIIEVETYSAAANKVADQNEDEVEFRLFCKTGDFASGTAELRLSY